MQEFFDYKIKDTSLINNGQDNTLRAYFHDQKWKMVEDLESKDDYINIPLSDETKENFKEFYKNEFFEFIHTKLNSPVVVSEFVYKNDEYFKNNPYASNTKKPKNDKKYDEYIYNKYSKPFDFSEKKKIKESQSSFNNYDFVQFKCVMQEMYDNLTDPLNLQNNRLPIEQFSRQVEYYGIQKEISNVTWNDFRQFLEQENTIKMYYELIDFYNKNFVKIKTRTLDKDLELNEYDVNRVLNYLTTFLGSFRVAQYSDYSEEKYKEGTILDLFMFREQSIDIFSNHSYDEDIYYNNQYDTDLDQTQQENLSKNPEIQQELKLVCFSNYDINRLFGDNNTLNKIMDI